MSIAGVAATALAAMALPADHDRILYNHSPSVPVGFYLRDDASPATGAFVTVRAGDVAPRYAASRDFTDANDRFIKRIAAGEGAEICAEGNLVRVAHHALERFTHDSIGRALPAWNGCRVLAAGEFFLIGDTSDSFDSRYFGVVKNHQIEGVWRPLSSFGFPHPFRFVDVHHGVRRASSDLDNGLAISR